MQITGVVYCGVRSTGCNNASALDLNCGRAWRRYSEHPRLLPGQSLAGWRNPVKRQPRNRPPLNHTARIYRAAHRRKRFPCSASSSPIEPAVAAMVGRLGELRQVSTALSTSRCVIGRCTLVHLLDTYLTPLSSAFSQNCSLPWPFEPQQHLGGLRPVSAH